MPHEKIKTDFKDKQGVSLCIGDKIIYDDEDYMNIWVRGEKGMIIQKEDGRIAIRMKPFGEFTGSNQNILNDDDCDVITKIK